MSKTRKILSVVLAAALVFALAIPAFAVSSVNFESAADAATYTQEWSLAEPVLIEDGGLFPDHIGEYYIDVILKTNYPTGSVEFEVETTGDVVFEGAEMYDYYSYTNEEDEMCWNADINFNNNKVILVPDSSAADDAIVFTTADGEGYFIATIFVSGTNGTVAIKNDPKNATNTGGTLIAARLNPAKVTGTMIVGQTATVGAAVNIGSTPDPVLKGKDGTAVVINTDITCKGVYDGIIYGFTGARLNSVNYYNCVHANSQLAVENGTVTVVKGSGGYGTGTTVELYNLEGTKVATYVIVIFGDVDGNGSITTGDLSKLQAHFGGGDNALATASPEFIAANVASQFNRITTGDLSTLQAHFSGGDNAIVQATLGAKHTYKN